MRILFSPHNDDEGLFASIIIQRLRPLMLVIVTDSVIQERRGDPITWQQRRQESADAAQILGVPICFLGLPDADLTENMLLSSLRIFNPTDDVIAPALQGGNPQHDIVAKMTEKYFAYEREYGLDIWRYATYAKGECFTPIAATTFIPTPEEAEVKSRVLACYKTQLALRSTLPHFEAVAGQPEYISFPKDRDDVE